jgi:catechol 2,3-dioxygenase-like lactoylglutathione lyase family enzyme
LSLPGSLGKRFSALLRDILCKLKMPKETTMNALYQSVSPYQADAMNLPVKNLDEALPFYQTIMGFQVVSRQDAPVRSAVLGRDGIQIGLAENGGDPAQDGCFFAVDAVERAFEELKANGLKQEKADYRTDQYGETSYRVFFVVAPDGLCYCLGQRQA